MRRSESSADLRGFAPLRQLLRALTALLLSAMLCTVLAACNSISPQQTTLGKNEQSEFKTDMPPKVQEFATPDRVKSLDTQEPFEYRFGPGDRLTIQVWRRPELTQEGIVVSPDGMITVPRIGSLQVLGKSVGEVQALITSKLETFYIRPEVTVRVLEFHNNKAFVLGRVSKPGVINFPGQGSLLEALALAGGIPDQNRAVSLTKCAIIRGNDTIIWIDLQDLLRNGNMALNAPIRNNDVIYIPEAADEMVYVLGEVVSPGAIEIKSGMTVIRAIMLAGGMNAKADPEKIFVIRQQTVKGEVVRVDLKNLLEKGDFTQNFSLMSNDIIYVSPGGMAKFNYALEKLLPSMQMLNLNLSNLESLGIMQELRQKVWGQKGFVTDPSGE
ncbi:MAG: polysaccharide biosynthesis/export family protein [Chlorobiaceae bacterium]|nr:polysaccharide biosynthesis/export family protein [Chlorobiaceae bacterium]